MKTTTFAIAAVTLLQLTSAQPFKARRHVHQHAKKEVVTVVNTVEAPDVIVYVDQNGKPYSTGTEAPSAATPAPQAPAPQAPAPPAPAPAAPTVAPAPPVENKPASSPPAPAAPAPAPSTPASSSSSSSEQSGFGVAYSPYSADGSCKTQDQVNQDFEKINGYSLVRIYGCDCNQVVTVGNAAKAKGMKLFAGVYNLGSLSSEIATIVSAAAGDWSHFDTINIGNELVNSGTASASAVVAALGTARGLLKTAGYPGKIVTVDTLVAARAHPELCDNSDYCAVNSHPYYDGHTVAADSGKFLQEQIPTLRNVLSNKGQEIVITETGWPWKGQNNGVAVPSPENQASALSSIKSAFSSNPEAIILFTTFNDMWKKNTPEQFQAEQYWGMLGDCPSG